MFQLKLAINANYRLETHQERDFVVLLRSPGQSKVIWVALDTLETLLNIHKSTPIFHICMRFVQ